MIYLLHLIATIGIYVVLGQSLNLALGFGGMLSLCTAAFAGVGAYSASLLMVNQGLSFYVAVAAGASGAGALALAIGYVAQRLRGDFFVMATMGLQIIISAVLMNWTAMTGGPAGLPGIPRPVLPSGALNPRLILPLFIVVVSVAVVFLVSRLSQTDFGKVLQAVRDDSLAALALGKRPEYFRSVAFGLSGALAGVAGALYAVQITYIDPTSFDLEESVLVLAIVLIGGSGTVRGPVIGAIVLLLLPELLRFVGIPASVAPNLRQVIYGGLLVLMMFYRPQGLAGRYELS